MSGRALERSRDNGKTWEPCTAERGSIMWHTTFPPDGEPVTDGLGNWYRRPGTPEPERAT